MILLDGHSLNRKIQFRPESQSLTLEERKGQSSLTLGDGAPEIQVGDWMLDDTAPGAGIVWRVKTADTAYFREASTRTIQLEHIVNTLRDGVIFGELKWENGCTASAAISHILGLTGGLWTLGTFEPQNVTWPYKFNACSWMDALETVTRTLEDAWWDYDLSSLPFKLHIRSLAGQTDSEMRMSRNITGIRRSVDRSRMYTRFYPIGLNDMHLPEEYLSRNEEIYGTCCKIETNQAIDSEGELRSWARDRLKRHCEPIVTVTVSGLDLSRDTGEPLDALRLNRVCRAPLPEFGTTILEKVCRLQWPDKIKAPEKMNVTLANEKEDIASIFNQQAAGGEASRSGGGRGAKKKIEEDHAWFVDTSDHVAMVAEAIIGQGPDGVDWSRVAILSVDGYGIHGRVTRAEGYLVTMTGRMDMDEERLSVAFDTIASVRSELDMTAESLRVAFANDVASVRSEFSMTAESLRLSFDNDIASVRSSITVTAESLRSSFSNDISSVRSSISQQADRIDLVVEGTGENASVRRAAIQAAVVNSNGELESSIKITADNIDIDGDTFAGYLQGTDIVCETINCDTLDGTSCNFDTITVNSGISVDGNSIANPIMSVTDPGYSGNSKTVTFTHADGTEETVTFSRATSLSGAWSGATYTVTASPQGNTNTDTVYQQIEGATNPNATAYAKMYHTNPSVAANQIGSAVTMTLDEKVSSKKVDLLVNSLVKATVSTASTWTAGYNQGSPSSGTAGGRTSGVSSLVHDFTITKVDGTTKTIQIDVTSIYTTARTGYTLGTFTQATVTPQGTAYGSITPVSGEYKFKTQTLYTSSGSETYYNAGSGYTYYKGNGSSVTGRGDPVSRVIYRTLYKKDGSNYESVGLGSWFMVASASVSTLYQGNGSTVTGRGDKVTGTDLGSPVTVTQAGGAVTAYLLDNNGSTVLYGAGTPITDLRNPGTADSTTYYTKS